MYKWPFSLALEVKIKTKNREYLFYAQFIKLNKTEIK